MQHKKIQSELDEREYVQVTIWLTSVSDATWHHCESARHGCLLQPLEMFHLGGDRLEREE